MNYNDLDNTGMDNYEDLEQSVYEVPIENVKKYTANSGRTVSYSRGDIDLRQMPVTLIIIIANIIAEILCMKSGADRDTIIRMGGLNYEYIHSNYEFMRVFSYMFLHVNLTHLVSNMVALFMYGSVFERAMGSLRMAVLYIASGIFAGIFSVEVSHMINPDYIRFAVGASGAIFGVMCASVFVILRGNESKKLYIAIAAIVLVVVYAFVSNSANSDIWGHIGGAIAGGILVFVICINKWQGFDEEMLSKLAGIVIIIVLCAAGIDEAHIGKQAQTMSDERIEQAKAMQIYNNDTITLGECLDKLDNATWTIFTASNKESCVEFNGNMTYNGAYVSLKVQCSYVDSEKDWLINYVAIDGTSQSSKQVNTLFAYLTGK